MDPLTEPGVPSNSPTLLVGLNSPGDDSLSVSDIVFLRYAYSDVALFVLSPSIPRGSFLVQYLFLSLTALLSRTGSCHTERTSVAAWFPVRQDSVIGGLVHNIGRLGHVICWPLGVGAFVSLLLLGVCLAVYPPTEVWEDGRSGFLASGSWLHSARLRS